MKKLTFSFLWLCTVAVNGLFAQTANHLLLSNPQPAAGEKITLTYDPEGTVLAGKAGPDAMVYFLDNKDYPVADVTLKADGKLLKGEFTIPENAKTFFVKIYKGTDVDNNNDQGYVYLVYKNQQPVDGAYAMKAYMLFSGMGVALGKIKTDMPQAVALYQKDFELYPKDRGEYQNNYAALLIASPNPADKAMVNPIIAQLMQSNDEKNMMLASTLLRRLKKTASADSLTAVIKTKFPDGITAKNEMGTAFSKEKDPVKKEELYKAYFAKYPEAPSETAGKLNNFSLQLASAYLAAGKLDDYKRVLAVVKNKANLAMSLNNAAYEMAKKGEDLDEDAKMSKQSLELIQEKIKDPGQMAYQSPASIKKMYESSYDLYGDTYAFILTKQGKLKEALAYEQPIYEHEKGADIEVNEHYTVILQGLGKSAETKEVIEAALKTGKSSEVMNGMLKDIYVKSKGSADGFDAYVATLKSSNEQAMRAALAKEMINKPAPLFALKGFDGKTVSLADLKGKIVVVDFWATWCGPCKASFPGMQMALNKFKNNPNVVFLFIDTWETVENYQAEAQKFIADNKYSFKVLEDEKLPEGKQGKVVTAYGVEGIPTKFVLDVNGNIRFKHIGFSGTADGLVDEVSAMIDMATHPETANNVDKTTINKSK